jgi:hypothetical protein
MRTATLPPGAPYLPDVGRCGNAESQPAAFVTGRDFPACPEQAPRRARCASNGCRQAPKMIGLQLLRLPTLAPALTTGHEKVKGHGFSRAKKESARTGAPGCAHLPAVADEGKRRRDNCEQARKAVSGSERLWVNMLLTAYALEGIVGNEVDR